MANWNITTEKYKQTLFTRKNYIQKGFIFIASLYLFMLAITLMKDGANGLSSLIDGFFSIDNIANSLGFGWMFAYVIMSGSPVAASALAFYNNGTLDQINAFAMITGSRLGASFFVILVGFIYVLRGRDRATSLSMGSLSLIVTISTYLPSFFLGMFILRSESFAGVEINTGQILISIFDRIIHPISERISMIFSDWFVFLIGLFLIMLSFNLFDKCVPQMTLKQSQFGQVSRLVYHPLVMFVLGAAVTLISMSVSISLSILVPLSNRGFIRRENIIPYIMGANITTFIDTLLAAALLDLPSSITIVLTSMISISIVSILILVFFNHQYQLYILNISGWITNSNRNLVLFILLIVIVPICLLII